MNRSKIKVYAVSIAVAEVIGGVSALFTSLGMEAYKLAEKPTLTPPEIVFPIVWTILYALMGISAARIWMSPPTKERNHGLIVYAVQLLFNFLWSIFFFNLQAYGFSFFWLLALWALVLSMIIIFNRTDRLASLLQIPYLLWLTFAAYLNLLVWLLNR